jgi:hypothetical protein
MEQSPLGLFFRVRGNQCWFSHKALATASWCPYISLPVLLSGILGSAFSHPSRLPCHRNNLWYLLSLFLSDLNTIGWHLHSSRFIVMTQLQSIRHMYSQDIQFLRSLQRRKEVLVHSLERRNWEFVSYSDAVVSMIGQYTSVYRRAVLPDTSVICK